MLISRIVERRIRRVFDDIGRRDVTGVVAQLAPDVEHRFAGDHALGGERHTRQAVATWFERLFRLYPQLTFTVHRVVVSGWPWDLLVAVEWTADAVPAAGSRYVNVGAHVIRIRRGQVAELHAYEDSLAVDRALREMAAAGVAEAAAPPIT